MSFLPYARSGPATWWPAGSVSALMHAGLIGFAIASAQGLVSLAAVPPVPEPKFKITLTPLDSDTIAGLKLQDGEAGADGTDGLDAMSAVPTPETLGPNELPARAVARNKVESLSAIAPTNVMAVEELQRIAPKIEASKTTSPLVPATAAPLAAQLPVLAVPIEPMRPTAAMPTQALSAAAPALTTVPPLRPTSPTTTNKPDAVAQTAAQTAQDLAIADLLRRIRSAPSQSCFLALPRRDGDTGVGLALIANSEDAMLRFTQSVLTKDDTHLRQTRTLLDERQCAALTYIRQNRDYPATRLGLSLDTTFVPSSGRLTGTLRGTAGRYVTLLLIDNNGVVQDLQRFLTFSGNVTRFDVPVTRAGPPRDTGQVLLAVATRTPAPILRDRAGRLAANVFSGLTGPVVEGAALGIATFDVVAP